MGNINVNQNVFNAIQNASTGYVYGRDAVSNTNVTEIENAMGADGKIDDGEAQVLDRLRNKQSFTVTAGGQSLSVTKDLMEFDPKQVSFFSAGTKVSNKYSDGQTHTLPANIPAQTTNGYQTNVAVNGNGSWEKAKTAFLDINNWEKTADSSTGAEFKLTDANGKLKNGPAKVGDLIRIDIPGPGSGEGGYDWVRVEDIKSSPNEVQIKVRPYDKDKDGSADHFFTSQATNTFTLTKGGTNQIQFRVNGRNEVSNGMAAAGQNAVGYFSGLQEGQWENLGSGIMKAAK